MPSRQAPLDAKTREKCRGASREQYEAKNLEKRCGVGKLRMRRYRERAAAHSESYDWLDAAEREQRRIADAESRCARKQEAESLRKKHAAATPCKTTKDPVCKTPHKPAKKVVLDPLQTQRLGAAPRRRGVSSEQEEDSKEEQDGGTQCPLPQLFFEARGPHPARLRCKACGLDGCVGCACMCKVSVHWFDHPDGHFFPECKSCGRTDCPGLSSSLSKPLCDGRDFGSLSSLTHMPFGVPPYDNGVLLCIPIYKPDRGHEDKDTYTSGFFAVVHDEGSGNLRGIAGAFHDLWTLDCNEYHNHENESPETHTRFALRIRQQKRTEEHYKQLVATDNAIREEEEEKQVKMEEMDYLAATRLPPVPLSPERARQQFERVLGLGAGMPPPPFMVTAASHSCAASPMTMPSPPQTLRRTGTFLEHTHQHTCQLQVHLPAYAEVGDLEAVEALGLYAIHAGGHNRVFNNRERAVEVLQQTPGGELIFVGDEQRLWELLNKDGHITGSSQKDEYEKGDLWVPVDDEEELGVFCSKSEGSFEASAAREVLDGILKAFILVGKHGDRDRDEPTAR
ncbi:hypothetical protein B0H14DRAFT_3759971 [Mycena olivaceomarginata]|nr:hypothetical protein B0H14DRAFT_3759971 [Mycena olivaceomarginata]